MARPREVVRVLDWEEVETLPARENGWERAMNRKLTVFLNKYAPKRRPRLVLRRKP